MSSAAAEEAFATAASAPGPQDEAYLSEVFHLFTRTGTLHNGALSSARMATQYRVER